MQRRPTTLPASTIEPAAPRRLPTAGDRRLHADPPRVVRAERLRGVAMSTRSAARGGLHDGADGRGAAAATAMVERTDTARVVGAGVGYEAALLAQLARSVVALEENPELARIGRSALVDHRIASVSYVEAPLSLGHRQRVPYDLILFGGAVTEIPGEINAQLADGGRMAVVLRQHECVGRATLITRTGGALAPRVIFDAATPLLPGLVAKAAFVF